MITQISSPHLNDSLAYVIMNQSTLFCRGMPTNSDASCSLYSSVEPIIFSRSEPLGLHSIILTENPLVQFSDVVGVLYGSYDIARCLQMLRWQFVTTSDEPEENVSPLILFPGIPH